MYEVSTIVDYSESALVDLEVMVTVKFGRS